MAEAAESLGVSSRRVRALISDGRLRAHRVGALWMIGRSDLNQVRERKPGRPKGSDGGACRYHRRQDWRTPKAIFDDLNSEFDFTCDVAASSENALLPVYFTSDSDGLKQSWKGQVCFCNPPFVHTAKWVRKALMEAQENHTTTVMILPARTGNKIWHEVILPRCEVRFIAGRVHFDGADYPAPFDLAVVIFRALDIDGCGTEAPRRTMNGRLS